MFFGIFIWLSEVFKGSMGRRRRKHKHRKKRNKSNTGNIRFSKRKPKKNKRPYIFASEGLIEEMNENTPYFRTDL